MLNPFPLMFLTLLAHTILRIVAGSVLLTRGMKRMPLVRKKASMRWVAALLMLIEVVMGALLFAGFSTQYAALAVLCYTLLSLMFHKKLAPFTLTPSTQVLLAAIALSLFITGAGAFAFDIPF